MLLAEDMRRSLTCHFSSCYGSTAHPRMVIAVSLEKMLPTRFMRLMSLLTRLSRLVLQTLLQC